MRILLNFDFSSWPCWNWIQRCTSAYLEYVTWCWSRFWNRTGMLMLHCLLYLLAIPVLPLCYTCFTCLVYLFAIPVCYTCDVIIWHFVVLFFKLFLIFLVCFHISKWSTKFIRLIWYCNNTRKIRVPTCRNINDVSGLNPLQQPLVIGRYVKMLMCEIVSNKIYNNARKFWVPTSRNVNDVSGLSSLPLTSSLHWQEAM